MTTTPLDTSWCNSFAWLNGNLTVDKTQSVLADGAYCRVCDSRLSPVMSKREAHAKHHQREWQHWLSQKQAQVRSESTERLRELSKLRGGSGTPKQPVRTAREDGVPDAYLKESGVFKTGYDSKLKAHLVAAAQGKQHPDALHKFSKPAALKLLEARGWMGYLDRK